MGLSFLKHYFQDHNVSILQPQRPRFFLNSLQVSIIDKESILLINLTFFHVQFVFFWNSFFYDLIHIFNIFNIFKFSKRLGIYIVITLLCSVILKTELYTSKLVRAVIKFSSSSFNVGFEKKVSNDMVSLNYKVSLALTLICSILVLVLFWGLLSNSSDFNIFI